MPSPSPRTLAAHVADDERKAPERAGLSALMASLSEAACTIAFEVRRAGLAGLLGRTGESNVQGEEVQKLDAYADEVLRRALDGSGQVCLMASEENAAPIPASSPADAGPFVVVFDPMDGSSNIDANVGIGTIFGIYRRRSPAGGPADVDDLLQPGDRQLAAGYVLYGPATMLVYAGADGVHGFTLDPDGGGFVRSHPSIRTPPRGAIFSVNEGNLEFWDPAVQGYIRHLKSTGNARGKAYSGRYIGSLVADFHRNLLYGGIFLYPADRKDPRRPRGKLRLLYEANPLARVAEAAGGAASDGQARILGLVPRDIHERVPLYIGSAHDVAEAGGFPPAD